MSQPEEDEVQDQQEDEQEQQDQDNEDQDDQQDEEEDDGEDEDDDQEDDDDQQEGDQQDQDQNEQKESKQQKFVVPTFKKVISPEFQFQNLTLEICNLQNTVNSFINTLPSQNGMGTGYNHTRPYRSDVSTLPYQTKTSYRAQPIEKPNTIIMKDEDIQVSMQPQIIIQPTIKQEQIKQPYRVSNESEKFLAQLYEENKKLRRWQNATNTQSSAIAHTKERFQRKEYEKGLFNIQQRNKEIDEAIQLLRREQ